MGIRESGALTMNVKAFLIGIVALGALASPANASLVTSISGGTTYDMPEINAFGSGPQTFGDNIVWTSTNSNAVFGYTNGYGFADNGNWSGNPPMAGSNGAGGSITFTMDSDVSAVGGIINWASIGETFDNVLLGASISAYNSTGDLLETYILMAGGVNLTTPDSFYGFSRSEGDIRSFVLTDSYIGLRSLTISAPEGVPEPSTWAMMILGFGAVGFAMRRRREPARGLLQAG